LVNREAVSRDRYGVEKTVDTHKILINAIQIEETDTNLIPLNKMHDD
jgi:hypothetical protein